MTAVRIHKADGLRRQTLRLLRLGDHAQAEALFAQVLRTRLAAIGENLPVPIAERDDLVQCHAGAGPFGEAAADYS